MPFKHNELLPTRPETENKKDVWKNKKKQHFSIDTIELPKRHTYWYVITYVCMHLCMCAQGCVHMCRVFQNVQYVPLPQNTTQWLHYLCTLFLRFFNFYFLENKYLCCRWHGCCCCFRYCWNYEMTNESYVTIEAGYCATGNTIKKGGRKKLNWNGISCCPLIPSAKLNMTDMREQTRFFPNVHKCTDYRIKEGVCMCVCVCFVYVTGRASVEHFLLWMCVLVLLSHLQTCCWNINISCRNSFAKSNEAKKEFNFKFLAFKKSLL